MLACVSTAALPFAVALAAPATRRARVNVGVGFGVGVTARAPPFGSLAGTRDPPGGSTPHVFRVRHQLHVGRVHTPWDPAQMVALETWRNRSPEVFIDDPVSLPDMPTDLDVAVPAIIPRAGPLP